MQGYVQFSGASDVDFEVVGEHVEADEELIEQGCQDCSSAVARRARRLIGGAERAGAELAGAVLQITHPSACTLGRVLIAAGWTRGDVLGLVGVIVSGIGFIVAIWQIVRTANAAEATQRALIASNRTQFLFLLPQFRQLEIELDLAVSSDERNLAARALSSYSHLANEVAALVEELGIGEGETITDLRRAGRSATTAKNEIYAAKNKRLSTITADFYTQMNVARDHISRLRTVQAAALAHQKG